MHRFIGLLLAFIDNDPITKYSWWLDVKLGICDAFKWQRNAKEI
jgi:hypothetical protein